MMKRQQSGAVKQESYILASLKTLKKEPSPKGMKSREIVRRAIEFDDPPRIPYYFLFHPNAADIGVAGPLEDASDSRGKRVKGETYVDKWGVTRKVTGRFWDHPIEYPLADLRNLSRYRFPDPLKGITWIKPLVQLGHLAGKYMIGWNSIGMYETMRSLMGFEELMMAPYTQPDGLRALLGRLTEMTIQLVDAYHRLGGVDGFLTAEDWGLQTTLQMNVRTFREFYRPSYQKIIDACHDRGMHFFWHNCGYIVDMFPDMIEMGVDVLQLDQPRLMGHQTLIDHLGGKICLWNTVDIQWCTSEKITDKDIIQEVAHMVRVYDVNRYGGGFIAKHYPQPWDIGLSPARQRLIYDAFMANGCRL